MKEYEFSPFEYDWKWDDTKQVMRVTKREPTVAEWVAEVLEHCNCDREICISSVGRYVYVCDNAGQMAKACCAVTDTFNKNTGIAIAYARLRHFPIHPAFKPKPAPKFKVVRGYPAINLYTRVYDRSNKLYGTVMDFSPAGWKLVTVKWDKYDHYVAVPKSSIRVAITGES